MTGRRAPRYLVVREDEVDPAVAEMAKRTIRGGTRMLELGAVPEIRWFADTRELPPSRVATAQEQFVPGDGDPKAGSVPPFVRYSPGMGWEPARPVLMLNRSECFPDTALHELRHLWQIKVGRYRADETSTPELEADADAWAAEAQTRLGLGS